MKRLSEINKEIFRETLLNDRIFEGVLPGLHLSNGLRFKVIALEVTRGVQYISDIWRLNIIQTP